MRPKVLLFANVGTDKNGYCHVGDEAMFWQIYSFYQTYFPEVRLSSLVSLSEPHHKEIEEQRGLGWPDKKWPACVYFLKLCVKTWIWTTFGKSFFTKEQKSFIDFIKKNDVIHFTGGGNLTSVCEHWFYYALLVAAVAKLLKKPVIMTSQTIGPFTNLVDWFVAVSVLNTVKSISLRESSGKQSTWLRKTGLTQPLLTQALDVAYFSPTTRLGRRLLPKKDVFRVGLSLHESGKNRQELADLLRLALNEMSKQQEVVEVLLLPHVLDRIGGFDEEFLQSISSNLSNKISVFTPPYFSLAKNNEELTALVKEMTGTCDFVLASRYHGVLFSLSQAVPCLSLVTGKYQTMKNFEALHFMFGPQASRFLVTLGQSNTSQNLIKSLDLILQQREEIKRHLTKRNSSLHRLSQKDFHSLTCFVGTTLARSAKV